LVGIKSTILSSGFPPSTRERSGRRDVWFSHHNGKWFISIQTAREVQPPGPQGEDVGIDMGVVRLATLSDGAVVPSLNLHKQHAAALRKRSGP